MPLPDSTFLDACRWFCFFVKLFQFCVLVFQRTAHVLLEAINGKNVRRYGSYETWPIPTKASTMAVSIIPTEGLM